MKQLIIVTIVGFALVMVASILATMASSSVNQATALESDLSLVTLEQTPSEPMEWSKGPSNPPTSKIHDLDEYAEDWGVFCEGSLMWAKENVPTPSLDGISLRLVITDGAPYSNAHFYRNLLPEPVASAFTLTMPFLFTSTLSTTVGICNNQGGNSVVQALEFSISKWHEDRRYELALQWQNVEETPGDGAPQWRYWDPPQWVPINPSITQCLEAGQWYTLTLEGEIVDGQVHYHRFAITDTSYILDLTVPSVAAPGEVDRLATAVQLDGNFQVDPYDVFVDKVSFIRKPALSVTKQASPNPLQSGAQLTYTLYVTNNTNVTLTATITDILPIHVTPTGILTWTPTITAPGGAWMQQVIVTVETHYVGPLTNKVQFTTGEGAAMGTASVTVCANYCIIYLPTIYKSFGS
jgi:hypothetical protein